MHIKGIFEGGGVLKFQMFWSIWGGVSCQTRSVWVYIVNVET